MKRTKSLLYLLCCSTVLVSCNSNSLTQENAEKTIRKFLSDHNTKTSKLEVSPSTIRTIEKTNIYSQFNTSVRVNFISKDHNFTLLFDFTRTPNNKWFLKSVEGVDGPTQELTYWLKANKNLNIAAQ